MDRLSAKIALLGLVTNAVEKPSIVVSTPPEKPSTIGSRRTIPFKHERTIGQHLSFICGYGDDTLCTMAACIEEDHQNNRLILRYAANVGNHEALSKPMEQVARILQDEAKNGLWLLLSPGLCPCLHVLKVNRMKNFEPLLRVVLSLHRKRILSSLKHHRATSSKKTKNRRSFLKTWQKATGLHPDSSDHEIRSREIIAWWNDLSQRSNLLENMSVEQVSSGTADNHILCFIEDIDSFFEIHEADLLLTPIRIRLTDQIVNPLPSMRKLRRYVKVCNELLTAARRYRIFSRIDPCFVDLQQFRYGRSLDTSRLPGKVSFNKLVPPENILLLARRDKKTPSEIMISLSQRLGHETRLHAEIQLLLYYELHPTDLLPRIITSSKDSCYLCTLFFEVHGKFAVLRSHGHLDDDWKWPAPVRHSHVADARVDDLDYLLPAFMVAVDQKITESLQQKTGKKGDRFESRVSVDSFCGSSISSTSAIWDHNLCVNQQHLHSVVPATVIPLERKRDIRPSKTESEGSRDTIRPQALSTRRSPEISTRTRKSLRTKEKSVLVGIPIIDTNRAYKDAQSTLDTKLKLRSKLQKPSKRTYRQDSIEYNSWLSESKSQRTKESHQDNHVEKRRSRHFHSLPHAASTDQTQPIILQQGIVSRYPFNTKETSLRIWAARLHLNLEISAPEVLARSKSATGGEREIRASQGTQLEIQWLESSIRPGDVNAFIVGVEDLSREGLPEGILFSESGLVIRERGTLIQMRAVSL